MKIITTRIKPRNIILALIPLVMLTALFASCKKSATENSSPEFYIRESETLVIPSAIALPVKGTRLATYFAKGVQRYKAQAITGSSPVKYEWVLLEPKADLFDGNNYKVGTHSAGPAWRLTGTLDSILGQQFVPAKAAASPDANSIDWLQLMPKSGSTPTGIFANTAYIQRIATNGGKKPATAPVSETETVDVPYTAVYRFTKN